jgi:hypothetical protein
MVASFPRPRGPSRPLAPLLGALLVSACSPSPRPKTIEMQPIGTVPDVPRAPEDDGEGDVTTPNSATPSPAKVAACTSTSFDDLEEALKGCEVSMPSSSELPRVKGKLDVRVTASTPSTTPGGRVDLQIVFRNTSSEALPLIFTGDPAPRFDVEAVDAKGKRVDLPAGKQPGYPRGYIPPSREVKAYRVMLGGGGTARLKMAWDAVKTTWAPDKAESWEGRGFPRVPAGPLKKGTYTLRIVLPLVGVFEKNELGIPKVPTVVGF